VSTKSARLAVAGAALVVGLAACGSSGGSPSAPSAAGGGAGAGGAGGATASARPPHTTLDVLVTNDDGVGSAGIDAVARALAALPNTAVHIVAPAANQSDTGGKTTVGDVSHDETTTASGLKATEVSGFPADAVAVALNDLGLEPDLVVSGINEGQTLGPVVDLSGTVGAARAAATRGIPALAASQGLGDTYNYAPAVTQVLNWVAAHRSALLASPSAGTPAVANLNIPNCFAGGSVRGLRELASEPKDTVPPTVLVAQTCRSTASPADEIGAFNAGFATLTSVPASPKG